MGCRRKAPQSLRDSSPLRYACGERRWLRTRRPPALPSLTGEVASLTGEVASLTGEVASLTGEVAPLTGEVAPPPSIGGAFG